MSENDRSITEVYKPLSDESFATMAEWLMKGGDVILETLPGEEIELYRQAQHSVVDSRDRAGALTLVEIQRRNAGLFQA
jgi:hypothetical protein